MGTRNKRNKNLKNKMTKVTVNKNRFNKEWKSTGRMIKESPTSFLQTYEHPRFDGDFRQIGYDKFLGGIILEKVDWK